MPRYVILEHDWPELHWDLMLEVGAVLRTWKLSVPPQPGESKAAFALSDHRLHYLDYEGPLSDHRGQVTRWDAGTFRWLVDEPDFVKVSLTGERLCGTLWLFHLLAEAWIAGFTPLPMENGHSPSSTPVPAE